MPFSRPTLPQILSRITADLESRLGITLLYRSVLRILATAYSGAVHTLYGYLDWLSKQLMPDTAEAAHLARWASIFGVTRKAASFAEGSVTLTGTNGTVVASGIELQRTDGVRYLTTTGGIIASGTLAVTAEAVDAGSGGNAPAGTPLQFLSPLAGVNSSAVVATGGLAGGADTETDEPLRTRLLERIQAPPHGGASFDYKDWALEVAGVTRAFVYPNQYGLGTVGVAILADNDLGGPVAPSLLVEDAQEHIDALRPVTADVAVWTPTAVPMNLELHIVPDTPAIRSAVTASIADLLRREAEPGKTILLSKIREAISTAAGENDHTLTAPSGNFTVDATDMAVPGTITWT